MNDIDEQVWAQRHHKPGAPIDPAWSQARREECERINAAQRFLDGSGITDALAKRRGQP